MAINEGYLYEKIDTTTLLRAITKLNRMIDNRDYARYWSEGVKCLCDAFDAQFASLHLAERPRDLDASIIRHGKTSPELLEQITQWEYDLDAWPTNSAKLDGSLPQVQTHTALDTCAICFPVVLNSIPSGAISFVWPMVSSPPPELVEQMHQVVQMFGGNGLRANQLLLTHSSREGSDLLYMIAQELTSTLDLTTVLNKATETVRTVLNAQASTLFRVDPDNSELIFMIPKGQAASVLEENRMPIDQGVVGWVATNAEPIIVNDAAASELFESAVDSKTGFTTRNILCVPLVIQEETVGVLEVLNKEDNLGFTEEDEEWLTRIGSQVAIAFENAHLFTQEQERVSELDTLNSISQTINSELDVTVILDKITQSVFDLLSGSRRSELLLVSQDRKHLNLVASAGLQADGSETGWQLPYGQGLAGWCVENNRPLNLRKAEEDERYKSWPELQPLGGFSVAAVPLTHRDKVIGAIVVYSVTNRPYPNDKIELLQTFANQAAISLQNAELYQNLRVEQERIIRTQEEVRHQLGRDLHDNTAQMLSLIIMNLDLTRQMLVNQEFDSIQGELDRLEGLARQANREIRTLLFELRPIILESRGLIPALHSYHEQLKQSMGCIIHLDAPRLKFQIKLQGASTIFSIIQEAVNNIRKHAKAKNVWIEVHADDENLTFRVEDDGEGFDFDDTIGNYDGKGSFGLLNMHERAAILDGELNVLSPRPGYSHGVSVTGSIPLANLIDEDNTGTSSTLFRL